MSSSSFAETVTAWADRVVGRPYRDLGRGPEAFDCLGLVLDAYAECARVHLPDPMSTADYHERGLRALAAQFVALAEGEPLEPLDVLHFSGGRPHLAVVEDSEWIVHATEGCHVARSRIGELVTPRRRVVAYRLEGWA